MKENDCVALGGPYVFDDGEGPCRDLEGGEIFEVPERCKNVVEGWDRVLIERRSAE